MAACGIKLKLMFLMILILCQEFRAAVKPNSYPKWRKCLILNDRQRCLNVIAVDQHIVKELITNIYVDIQLGSDRDLLVVGRQRVQCFLTVR